MSPYHIDPKVNYRRLGELSDELTRFWTRIQALYLDAVSGFDLVRSRVESDQIYWRGYLKGTELDSEEFQNSRMFTYSKIFSADFCTSSIHQATQGDVKARNSPGGSNFTTLGNLCLVALYDFWNDYLRREYVIAKGELDPQESDDKLVQKKLQAHASYDLWGDLRRLRISIVHNQGIATSEVQNCKLIRWFQPGDPIMINPSHMRAILLAVLVFRNELSKEQFPKHYIQIPSQ